MNRRERTCLLIRRRRGGFSLVEAIVAMAVLSMALVPLFGLFAIGRGTAKRAEDLQTATYLGRTILDHTRSNVPDLTVNSQTEYVSEDAAGNLSFVSILGQKQPAQTVPYGPPINGYSFICVRELKAADFENPHRLIDVAITVTWRPDVKPVFFYTRVVKETR